MLPYQNRDPTVIGNACADMLRDLDFSRGAVVRQGWAALAARLATVELAACDDDREPLVGSVA